MSLTPLPRRFTVSLLFCSVVGLALPAIGGDRALAPRGPADDSTAPEVTCSRQFATIGIGGDRVRIDPSGAENQGNEIGRFWDSNHSGQANNFDGSCPSQSAEQVGGGWWELSQPPLRGLRAIIGEPGCVTNGCPDGPLTVLVEELGEDPEWDTPYFIALQVDPTPDDLRWWDLARVDPAPSPSVLTMQPFPVMNITGSSRVGLTITIDILFADIASAVHAVSGPGSDTPLPTSAIVKSHDVYHHFGNFEPGRFAADWTLLQQFPYEDGPTEGSIVTQCGGGTEGEHFAVGLTFHGGEGPDIHSALVGLAISLECDFGISNSARGVVEYGVNPCFGDGEALVATDPCNGRSSLLDSYVVDLEQHLCEMVLADGYYLLPWPPFECNSVDVHTVDPAVPDCLVQVRQLTAEGHPEGLSLEWAPLPCSDDYDVIRGDLDQLTEGGLGTLLCIENDTVLLEAMDTTGQDPIPGYAYFYLVRARGAVGSVHYGYTSEETPRLPTPGDCPID